MDVSDYRRALAHQFPRFELRTQADAMEALDYILKALHLSAAGEGLCHPPCIAHRLFGLDLREQLVCKCGNRSRREWDTFHYDVYAADILEDLLAQPARDWIIQAVGQLARRNSVTQRHGQECPAGCGRTTRCTHTASSAPEAFILNVVWTGTRQSCKSVLGMLSLFPHSLDLSDLFSTQLQATYSLKSFLVFGFNHYQTYCRGTDDDQWRRFDDSRVQTFKSFTHVLSDVLLKHCHPVGVFYERLPPSISFPLPAVKPTDWLLLSKQAEEADARSLQLSSWLCPVCQTENEQQVCQKCYALQPGLTGWACGRCSSINLDSVRVCSTCQSQRTRKCQRCGGIYEGEKCEMCTKTFHTCRRCHRQADRDGLCGMCSASSTDLLGLDICEHCGRALVAGKCQHCLAPPASFKQSRPCADCGRALVAGKCQYCLAPPTPVKQPRPCPDCGAVHTGSCLDQPMAAFHSLPVSSSSTLRQGISPRSTCLRCKQSSQACHCGEPPVSQSSLCLVCNQPSHSCQHSISLLCPLCGHSNRECLCFSTSTAQETCSTCKTPFQQEKYCLRCQQRYALNAPYCVQCVSARGFICARCRQNRMKR